MLHKEVIKKMKKALIIMLCLVVVIALSAGCGNGSGSGGGSAPAAGSGAGNGSAPAAGSGSSSGAGGGASAVKTGMGIISDASGSKDATADANGSAAVNSYVAAVTIDSSGKIIKCKLDQAQTKIEFSNKGEVVTPLDSIFASKQDMGAAYGMKKGSGIGKEWNEQATAFAQYCEGKTVDEIKGIAVNDKGEPTGADLTSSVTITVTTFMAVVEKAVANAQDMGATADDTLGLGVETNIGHSANYGANTSSPDGVAQAYTTYVATSFSKDGKITSVLIDASQTNVNFDQTGKITSDLKAALQTKDELGDAYGMKKASSLGKEWNEQAASFASYITGKTVDEVKGIAVNDKGGATSADITSSVTIGVADFIKLVGLAAGNAR